MPPGDKSGHVVFHNWVVNTPMEMGIADADKAEKALLTARKFTNNFGMYVTGIDRMEGVDSLVEKKSQKNFFIYRCCNDLINRYTSHK